MDDSKTANQDNPEARSRWAKLYTWTYDAARDRFVFDDAFWTDLGHPAGTVGALAAADFADGLHPDDREGFLAALRRALTAKPAKDIDGQIRHRRADGGWAWMQMRGGPADPADDKRPAPLAGAIQDIQSWKETERQLDKQRLDNEIIIQAGRLGTWDWDIAGNHLHVNDVFLEIIGQPPEKGRERDFRLDPYVHPADLARLLATFEPNHPGAASAIRECEVRVQRPDGVPAWVLLRGRYVAVGPDGRPSRMAGTLQDVTARKNIEEAAARRDRILTAMNEVAQMLLADDDDGAPDGGPESAVWRSLDLLGRASEVDRVYIWQNHFGPNGEPLTTTQLEEWSLGAEPQQGNELTINVPFAEVGASWERIFRENRCVNNLVRRMSATERAQLDPQGVISILIAPIRHEGRFWGFIGFDDCHRERVWNASEEGLLKAAGMIVGSAIARRQSQREREIALEQAREYARQAEAAVHAKDDFLARVGEEIRGPMRDVHQAARQLSGDAMNDIQQEYVEIIHRRAQSLERLLGDLTDYSLLEAGRVELENLPFDLERAVEETCSEYAAAAQQQGLEFVIQMPAELPPRVVGDHRRVMQILDILVNNAVKYTPAGEVVVQVVGEPLDAVHCAVRLAVMDTGVGIAPELRHQFDQTLFGGPGQPLRKKDGTGFGLALARRLVRLMNGRMGYVGQGGVGSTFWAQLPLALPAMEDRRERPRHSGRALVLEANENAALALAMTLGKFGVDVDTVYNEEDAAARLGRALAGESPPYAWVFLDASFHVERPDGPLRRPLLSPEAGEIRRILTISFAQSDRAVGFTRQGYAAVLFKPVRTTPLHEILDAADWRKSRPPASPPTAVQ